MGKDYHQFCGLAKAVGVLGERWTLLIIRDLSVGPRRFKDLSDGLAGIPSNVLTTRLRDLEDAGVAERRIAPTPQRGVLYALTPYGEELIPALDALGRWGAQRMADPTPEDAVTSSSLAAALRAGYQPDVLTASTMHLVRVGDAAAWVSADDQEVTVGTGLPDESPDLIVVAGPQLRMLLAGRLTPDQALAGRAVEIEGSASDFAAFVRAFHVPLDTDVAPT